MNTNKSGDRVEGFTVQTSLLYSKIPEKTSYLEKMKDFINNIFKSKKESIPDEITNYSVVPFSSGALKEGAIEEGVVDKIKSLIQGFFKIKQEPLMMSQMSVAVESTTIGMEELLKQSRQVEIPYDDTIREMEGNESGQIVLIKGMAAYELETSPMTKIQLDNGHEIFVSNQAIRDFVGMDHEIEGLSIRQLVRGLEGDEAKAKVVVEKMLAAGIKEEEVQVVLSIYHQGLSNFISSYLSSKFPSVIFGEDDSYFNLYNAGYEGEEKVLVIKGFSILKLTDPENIEDQSRIRHMKVDILVTNPGLSDPDLANVEYRLQRPG